MPAWLFLACLLAGLIFRVSYLDRDTVGHHQWRQSDTASVARHYARGETTFLEPMVDWGGVAVRGVEMELPAYQYAVGLLWSLLGESFIAARLLSLIAGLATLWFLFEIARREIGRPAAEWAVASLAVLPLFAFYSRSVQPESWMVAMFTGSILALMRWVETRRRFWFWVSACAASGAILLKAPSVVVGLPLLAVMIKADGPWFIRRASAWGYAAVALVPPILWYTHAARMGERTGRSFGVLGSDKWASVSALLDGEWWWSVWIGKLAEDHLAIVAVPLVMAGAAICLRARQGVVLAAWAAAMLIHILVASTGHMHHDYYQLPLVPVLAAAAGASLAWMFSRNVHGRRIAIGWTIALIVMSGVTLWKTDSKNRKDKQFSRAHARAIVEASPEPIPVVVVGMADPTVLFLADRFGLMLPHGGFDPDRIAGLLQTETVVLTGRIRGAGDRAAIMAGRFGLAPDAEGVFAGAVSIAPAESPITSP